MKHQKQQMLKQQMLKHQKQQMLKHQKLEPEPDHQGQGKLQS
ncbi:hypothetical protein L195_g064126, partial [Trifolium pratense]